MPLVSISNLSIGFRGPLLLDSVSCQIEAGQRIGLLGRNGAGKTTLMKILRGQVEPDDGDVQLAAGARVSFLQQDVPRDLTGTIREVVDAGLADVVARHRDGGSWDGVEDIPWRLAHSVDRVLSRMELDPQADVRLLSSGMKRRALLAQALVAEPDLLLLDEPTNHLDIQAINWLEDFLIKWRGTFLFVTHDRMFLRKLATRILEIDRGQLFDWSCDYATFLERKEQAIAAQRKQDALFDKRLAEEERWIRQGIKARRTRNEGRVKALREMRNERQQRQSGAGKVRLRIQEAQRSGNLVAALEEVTFSYDDRQILENFSTMLMRGDKVGIIGPNGAGKTTLLKILLGKLAPQSGQVRLGKNLRIAYFDQLREQLDGNNTVQENVGEGYDTVEVNGRKQHVVGYLQSFLFTPERARTEVRFLSGGERNRILLAKLFAKPANVIVLDEPTNDLDSESLELLEERLGEFSGTVVLVSHDREFLNNVVTSSIVFEPGGVKEYVGGYDDWLRQREPVPQETAPKPAPPKPAERPVVEKSSGAAKPRKLTYKETQELEKLPERIEQLEAEISKLHQAMSAAEFYQQSGQQIAAEQSRLAELESQLQHAFARWEELEPGG